MVQFTLLVSATTGLESVVNGPGGGVVAVLGDFITVSGGTGAGLLTFNWVVNGTLDAQGVFGSFIGITTNLVPTYPTPVADFRTCGGVASFIDPCVANSGPVVQQIVSVSVPFIFGTPLSTYWSFQGVSGTSSMGSSQSASGSVDFLGTLQPLVVFNSSGAQVTGATALSDSGFSYAVAAPTSTVPEPSTVLLFSSGLAGLVLVRRPRRQ